MWGLWLVVHARSVGTLCSAVRFLRVKLLNPVFCPWPQASKKPLRIAPSPVSQCEPKMAHVTACADGDFKFRCLLIEALRDNQYHPVYRLRLHFCTPGCSGIGYVRSISLSSSMLGSSFLTLPTPLTSIKKVRQSIIQADHFRLVVGNLLIRNAQSFLHSRKIRRHSLRWHSIPYHRHCFGAGGMSAMLSFNLIVVSEALKTHDFSDGEWSSTARM
jgi:hypothetical protein